MQEFTEQTGSKVIILTIILLFLFLSILIGGAWVNSIYTTKAEAEKYIEHIKFQKDSVALEHEIRAFTRDSAEYEYYKFVFGEEMKQR